MGMPQIVMILIMGANLGMNLIKDGEPQEGKYSFWATLAGAAIQFALLKWGGFF